MMRDRLALEPGHAAVHLASVVSLGRYLGLTALHRCEHPPPFSDTCYVRVCFRVCVVCAFPDLN